MHTLAWLREIEANLNLTIKLQCGGFSAIVRPLTALWNNVFMCEYVLFVSC